MKNCNIQNYNKTSLYHNDSSNRQLFLLFENMRSLTIRSLRKLQMINSTLKQKEKNHKQWLVNPEFLLGSTGRFLYRILVAGISYKWRLLKVYKNLPRHRVVKKKQSTKKIEKRKKERTVYCYYTYLLKWKLLFLLPGLKC